VREDVRLSPGPVVSGECDLLDAEPLEHAGLSSDSGDEGSDEAPVLVGLSGWIVTMSF
jgi:hypothetical protein